MARPRHEEQSELASIIIPTYNRAKFIIKTLDSVYAQTYRPLEIIVVDDGSIDDTKEVIKNWSKSKDNDEFKTRYIYQENGGAPKARNNGVRHAVGRYLQFLDSDDLILKDKISKQIEQLRRDGNSICVCNYWHVDEEGEVLKAINKMISVNKFIKEFRTPHTSGPVIDKNSFSLEKELMWNENVPKFQDKDYFIKLFLFTKELSYVDAYLFKWVWHSGERINDKKKNPDVFYILIKSIGIFTLKNINRIPLKRYAPLIKMNFYLFKESVVKIILRKIPKQLKFWHYFTYRTSN